MLQTIEDVELFFHERDKLGIKPGLNRVNYLLHSLEHPEEKIQTVHVAGTNGKGSTIQFINEALIRNNYTVGVFTSPSFTGIGGHFFINDVQASNEIVIDLMNKILPIIKELDDLHDAPTSFEIITVMAFVYFSNRVDIALIETGMGGRYDTTNCFVPEVSVITNISLDHLHFLGDTLADIAWHKAGIIKEHTPTVLGRMEDKESIDVFKKESTIKHAPLYRLGKDFHYIRGPHNQLVWFQNDKEKQSLTLHMEGKHQAENAAVAYMVLQLLERKGMDLSKSQVNKGIENAVLPGRFEIIHQNPPIILDSAHNIAGIHAFIHTLDDVYQNYRKIVLFAGFKDKQLSDMLQKLQYHVDEIIVTTFEHPRAANLEMFENILLEIPTSTTSHWKTTVHSFMQKKSTENTIFCVTGSLHFITEVRSFIKNLHAQNL